MIACLLVVVFLLIQRVLLNVLLHICTLGRITAIFEGKEHVFRHGPWLAGRQTLPLRSIYSRRRVLLRVHVDRANDIVALDFFFFFALFLAFDVGLVYLYLLSLYFDSLLHTSHLLQNLLIGLAKAVFFEFEVTDFLVHVAAHQIIFGIELTGRYGLAARD